MAKALRNQLAVPIGLLLAFVAAVGVWFIPINPERRAGNAGAGGGASWQQRINSSDSETPAGTETAPANWSRPQPSGLAELVPTLTGLREPPPEIPVIADETEDPDAVPEDMFVVPTITLNWEYQGSVSSGDTRAAMLMIDGRQRFLFEGESIANPEDPFGDRIEIVSVRPMVVVAETQGVEIRLPLTSLTPEQREAVMSGGNQAALLNGSQTIPPPRPASAESLQRQQAAADAARAERERAQPNRSLPTRTLPSRTRENNPSSDKASPRQPTRTPARPQRDQPQRREK